MAYNHASRLPPYTGWPAYPAYPWIPPPMPAYRPYAPAVPSQQPQPRSENAPTILKSIDNIGKGSEIPTEKKRKSEDFDGILTSYFTIPTIPSVRKFCRDGMLGESCRKRIQSFLKDHQPLQKLIERSKFLVSDV